MFWVQEPMMSMILHDYIVIGFPLTSKVPVKFAFLCNFDMKNVLNNYNSVASKSFHKHPKFPLYLSIDFNIGDFKFPMLFSDY